MKTTTKLIITILSSLTALTMSGLDIPALERPEAQITFVVKDDFGKPVQGAEVKAYTFSYPGKDSDVHDTYMGTTDANGQAVIKGKSLRGHFTYNITGGGKYYRIGWKGHEYKFTDKKAGRWEPWNPTIEITYKPVVKPIPMYVKSVRGKRAEIAQKNSSIGYDLVEGDWVAPYGKGKVNDFIFNLQEDIKYESAAKPYRYRLQLTFSNKEDGIQSWYGNSSGELAMPRYAPETNYNDNLELLFGLNENGYFKKREDQNYFFRIRTSLDDKGNVASALYGKISGNIKCDVINSKTGIVSFIYCLNPTPLDRNMEFDPDKNLFREEKQKYNP